MENDNEIPLTETEQAEKALRELWQKLMDMGGDFKVDGEDHAQFDWRTECLECSNPDFQTLWINK